MNTNKHKIITINHLIRSCLLIGSLVVAVSLTAHAEGQETPDSPLIKLLKSGRVPEARQGTIVEMIGQRGNTDDLAYLYQQALRPEGFTSEVRRKAFDALADAARTRKVKPAGDLTGLGALIRGDGKVATADSRIRLEAIRLAGLWKLEPLGEALRSIALSKEEAETVRAAAIDALVEIGGKGGLASITELTKPGRPVEVRALAVAALARLDPASARSAALAVLRDASGANPKGIELMLAAMLNRRDGAEELAKSVTRDKLPADAAKLALRAIYGLGRADPALVAALSQAAGINAEVKPLSQAELDQLIADVQSKGNAAHGEDVFRRPDLNCTNCHALSGAGGGIGPDLSALGSSSPVDYIINSIMLPDQAIKEEFLTKVVLTADGQLFQGIVVDRDDTRLVLKEATGEHRTIPADEIEADKDGGSLMPKGLVNFMTRAELVDLVRFLSELGKPGPFAIKTTPTIQRWRVLKPVPEELVQAVPDAETFRAQVLNADPSRWLPAYAKVAGGLPLADLTAETGGTVLYLQGEIDVSAAGPVVFHLDSAEGVRAWLDDKPMPTEAIFTVDLTSGRHALTLRVDTAARSSSQVRVEVSRGEGSAVEFAVVGGR
jgi:putative heme-binding domain-containing protein